uniref:Uncharacterized protein n=1 Tax=Manihot esculenta TaxID=3983 RepID=A0A2C9W402_MANES
MILILHHLYCFLLSSLSMVSCHFIGEEIQGYLIIN